MIGIANFWRGSLIGFLLLGVGAIWSTAADQGQPVGGPRPPFVDSTFLARGSADGTKKVRFELDGMTAGRELVITVPDSTALTLPAISAFAATLLDDANAAAALVTLGAAGLASPTFTGTVTLPITNLLGAEATSAVFTLKADEGDDANDIWIDTVLDAAGGRVWANNSEDIKAVFTANTLTYSSSTGVNVYAVAAMNLNLSAGFTVYSSVNEIAPYINSSNAVVTGSVAGDMVLRVATGKSILFTGDGGTTIHGRLNSSGFTGKFVTAGTAPTVANVGANSCGTTAASIAGNDNSFEITVGATAGTQCRVTLTTTAPVRWNCNGNNDTTVANLVSAKSVSTTQVDFYGTFVAGDVITGQCLPR